MYERYYGLAERPFELTPNPRFLLLTPAHREALNTIDYGISAQKGLTVLIGDAGTGKTTLLRKALAVKGRLRDKPSGQDFIVYLNNPKLTRDEFLELLSTRFELGRAAASSKAEFLRGFENVLRDRHQAGAVTTLIVDEAQTLSDDLLEEMRLLANIESDTDKLLQLVLAGQPELADRLNQPRLRQLKQRVALRCRLTPLTLLETAAYIAGRLHLAGGDGAKVFTRDAVIAVHEAAGGIPRTISVICDNALIAGFAAEEQPVGSDTIELVCRDLDFVRGVGSAAVASHGAPNDDRAATGQAPALQFASGVDGRWPRR
jgi:general secretion pathway protein A